MSGEDPAEQRAEKREAASRTLGAIVERYLQAKATALRAKSLHEAARHLGIDWKALHGLALSSVTRQHVADRCDVIARESGPVAANRARSSLSAMFVWAIGAGLADSNPVVGSNKQTENAPRERTLTDSEAAAVWLNVPDNDYGRTLKLILLTGCRREEIAALRWSEIDTEEARTITLPAERTKNHAKHVVPLSEPAMTILDAIAQREGDEFVFGRPGTGFHGWSKPKAALDKRLAFKEPFPPG